VTMYILPDQSAPGDRHARHPCRSWQALILRLIVITGAPAMRTSAGAQPAWIVAMVSPLRSSVNKLPGSIIEIAEEPF
jgi:hypothetical protein